jgi:hypothetical protein
MFPWNRPPNEEEPIDPALDTEAAVNDFLAALPVAPDDGELGGAPNVREAPPSSGFTVRRSRLFAPMAKSAPTNLRPTRRVAVASRPRRIDMHTNVFVATKRQRTRVAEEEQHVLSFALTPSLVAQKRGQAPTKKRELDLASDSDSDYRSEAEGAKHRATKTETKRQRQQSPPPDDDPDPDPDFPGYRRVVSFGITLMQRCDVDGIRAQARTRQKPVEVTPPRPVLPEDLDAIGTQRFPGEAPLGTEFYPHGPSRWGARGQISEMERRKLELDGLRLCALSMGDMRTTPIEVKYRQFEWYMHLCAVLPQCLGTDLDPVDRWPAQIDVHNMAAGAMLITLFGENGIPLVLDRVGRQFGVELQKIVICMIASRQCGKSFSCAISLLAAMMAFPGIDTATISTTQEVSKFILNTMRGLLAAYQAKFKVHIKLAKDSTTEIQFAANGSLITALSANADSNRGRQCHVVVVDEAQSVDPRIIYGFAMPLLIRDNRFLWLMGTPSTDPNNAFTLMINGRDHNGPMIKTLHMSLICKNCQRNGVKSACEHMQRQAAGEANASRRETVGAMIALISDKETVQAEMSGIIPSKDNGAFDPAHINFLFTRAAFNPVFTATSGRPPCMFMSVDPSFGGSSGFAVVIGYPMPMEDGGADKCVVRNNNNNKKTDK